MTVCYQWRGEFDNSEVNSLHAEGWVCAREGGALVGFVNVAWDGAAHAFILDTVVAERVRRRGVAVRLIAVAVDRARAAGSEWLHVDFESDLRDFALSQAGQHVRRRGGSGGWHS